jgi:hypothetical protein
MSEASAWPVVVRTYAVIGDVLLQDLRSLRENEVQTAYLTCLKNGQSALFKFRAQGNAVGDIAHFPGPWQHPSLSGTVVLPAEEPWYSVSSMFCQSVRLVEDDNREIEIVMLDNDTRQKLMRQESFHSLSGLTSYRNGCFGDQLA